MTVESLTEDRPADLRAQTISGVSWAAGARVGQQLLQFGITVVLARLLLPQEFGLVGMIAVFTGFAALFVDFGFAAALVQRRDLTDRHLSSAFWLNIGAGLAVSCVVAALAPALAALYGEPKLVPLTFLVAVNFLLGATTVVQTALLQRAMNFRRVAGIETASTIVGGTVAIAAAVSGAGVWSLVFQALATTAVRSALLWLLSDWRPQVLVDRQAVRDIWGFSGNLFGFSAVNYWSRNADNFLIGRFVGAAGLGIYARAYSTMLLPLSQISMVVSRVMFPALSRIQDDPERVKRAYLRAIGMIGLFTFPATVGLFVAAEPFVLALFGPRWEEVVPVLQILCVAGLTQGVGSSVGWIYQSQGRTDWMFRWGLAAGTITIVAFSIGIFWGLKGVATAYAIRTLALTYFNFSIPGRLIGMRFTDVVRAVRGVLTAALLMGGAVAAAGALLPEAWPSGLVLLSEVVLGVLVYCLLVHLFVLAPYSELRTIVADRLRRNGAVGVPA